MFGHWGVGQEVRHLRISGGLDGGFSYWRAFPQGWAFQTSPREVGHHSRGSGFCGVCGFCSGVQPAVVTPWCPSQELQFPAPSSLCSAYSAVWRSPCGWSWTKGTSSAGPGPSDKLIVWQAHQWLSPDRKKSRPARRRHPRRRLLGLLCLTGWALLHPQRRGRSHRSRPFQLAPEGPVHDPSKEARSLASLLLLPQPRNVDGSQVGARLADFAPHWRSLLGNCRATGIVEDGVGIAFQQRPQLTHQSISFRTRNSRQDLQQAVDALLMKGAIERVTNVRSLGFYSWSFLVPKKTGDLRPVINLSTLNRHMVVPHFKMETQGSVRSAIRSQEWAVLIDIRDAYLHVPMHQAVRKYLRFVVNKKVYQFTCLPFGLATSREFTKLLRPVVSLLRQQGVKLHVYLDDWLIRADTPEEAQLHSQTTIKVLQFLGWIINFEKSDLTPSQDFQFIGMQFNTWRFTVAPLPKMRVKVQSVHQHWMANLNITARDLHRLLGMLVFMASLVRGGRLRLRPVQWWAATAWCHRTWNWSDRIQVPQWVLLEVAWWSSPAVLQGLPLAARETEVTLFTDASISGLWSPVRLTLDTGTVVSISTIVPHKRSRDAGCHLCCERLPTSSEVPSGDTDVRQRSDGDVHQERGGHEIAHFDADDHWAAQVVRQQGDYIGSRPSARSTQYPGGFPVQSRPDSDHGESTTSVCQVGRTTDRYVCDIRQQTTRQVSFAISGPQGGVDRCHVHALGQGEGPLVRLPAIQDGPASSAEDRSITRTAGDTDRSTATGSIMVSRADGPNPRRPGSPVHGRSRPADTRREHGRGRDRDSSLPAVKSSRVETLGAILRAKGHSREAANMMSRCLRESSQVYEFHWSRFVAFCRTKRWQVFRVRSHHFSTYMMHLFRDGLLPSTIISHRTSVASVLRHWVYDPAADPHIKLLVRAGTSGATQNYAQVGSSSGFIIINETAVYISKWGWWGILGWRHSPKMADAQMFVPVSIGFGKTALVPARFEYSAWQMCVRERKHSTSTCGISTSGTWLPGEESATDAGPWMDHGTWDCSLESDGTGANVMSRSTAEALHPGLGKNPGGPAANVHSLEPQHQRYHEEPHKPMDRGDCQGSLHSSWSSVWPCDSSWGPSTVSVMGV